MMDFYHCNAITEPSSKGGTIPVLPYNCQTISAVIPITQYTTIKPINKISKSPKFIRTEKIIQNAPYIVTKNQSIFELKNTYIVEGFGKIRKK
jgi:hypothetical protein